MPVRNSVLTGALLAGTVATAAGLNLAVLGLGRTETAVVPSSDAEDVAAAPMGVQVALTSAELDPGGVAASAPTLAVGLAAQGPHSAQTGLDETVDPPTVAPAQTGGASTGAAPISTGGEPSTSVEPSTVPPVPLPSVQTAPAPSQPPTRPPTPRTTAAPPATNSPSITPVSTEYLTYEFEGVATIVVALHDGQRLEFWSVLAEDGWAYRVEDRGPTEVKVKFRPTAGGDEAEFELEFDDGLLKAKQEH